MDLVSVEPPAPRVALAGESPEFLDALFRIVGTGQLLQIVADQLIEAFAKGFGLFSGAGDGLLVNGKGYIH